jgi:Zn-dependent protease
MLPVTGLDGGTVLFSLLTRRKTPEKAALTMRIINLSLAALALFAAVYLCFHGKVNISLFITALYLIVISIIKM